RRILPQGAADAGVDRAGLPQRLRPRRRPPVHTHHAHAGLQGGREGRRPGRHVSVRHLHRDGEPRRPAGDLDPDRTHQGTADRWAVHRAGVPRGRDARGGLRAGAGRAGDRGGVMAGTATPEWETVIGLETHVQLRTVSKTFCGCSTGFGAPPNTNVCPVCLGLPGALPVLSREAVELAIKGALALNCQVRAQSRFARKNYFYPDLPKGYQISQYDEPVAEHGFVEILVDGAQKRIGVTRVHMEDDAGKSIHDGFKDSDRYSYVDLNRSGTPLIEIVSEPDLRTPDEAHAYLTEIKQVLQYIGVSDCDMEKGQLRCDA